MRPQAEAAGGALVSLLGNHELMNSLGGKSATILPPESHKRFKLISTPPPPPPPHRLALCDERRHCLFRRRAEPPRGLLDRLDRPRVPHQLQHHGPRALLDHRRRLPGLVRGPGAGAAQDATRFFRSALRRRPARLAVVRRGREPVPARGGFVRPRRHHARVPRLATSFER